MAASAAPPWLNDADLAAQQYTEAVAVAALVTWAIWDGGLGGLLVPYIASCAALWQNKSPS